MTKTELERLAAVETHVADINGKMDLVLSHCTKLENHECRIAAMENIGKWVLGIVGGVLTSLIIGSLAVIAKMQAFIATMTGGKP